MTDQNALLAETEAAIAAARAEMNDGTHTARAIDRSDGWGTIAEAARMDGFDDLAEALEAAEAEFEF